VENGGGEEDERKKALNASFPFGEKGKKGEKRRGKRKGREECSS